MRRACLSLAQRLPAALETAPGAASQLGRVFTTSASTSAPVHPAEEVYNR